jgi:hypothetical protein
MPSFGYPSPAPGFFKNLAGIYFLQIQNDRLKLPDDNKIYLNPPQ